MRFEMRYKYLKEELSSVDLNDEMEIWMHWNKEAENITAMNNAIEEWLD